MRTSLYVAWTKEVENKIGKTRCENQMETQNETRDFGNFTLLLARHSRYADIEPLQQQMSTLCSPFRCKLWHSAIVQLAPFFDEFAILLFLPEHQMTWIANTAQLLHNQSTIYTKCDHPNRATTSPNAQMSNCVIVFWLVKVSNKPLAVCSHRQKAPAGVHYNIEHWQSPLL